MNYVDVRIRIFLLEAPTPIGILYTRAFACLTSDVGLTCSLFLIGCLVRCVALLWALEFHKQFRPSDRIAKSSIQSSMSDLEDCHFKSHNRNWHAKVMRG